MNDSICLNFDVLRDRLPDELGQIGKLELKTIKNYKKYCPKEDCNSELDQITIGFLWLLEQCYSGFVNKTHNENNTNSFFLYMISWFSYKLKQKSGHSSTKINDLYIKHIKNNDKYNSFTDPAYKIGDLKEFMDKRNDFLNIDIEDMSKFYDIFKLLCSMYGNVEKNQKGETLSNNAIDFVKKYQELNKVYGIIEESPYNKILSTLSNDYNNLKNNCKNCSPLPEITENISAYISGNTSSSSSIGSKFFTVLSIFGAIAFFLGISYKVNNKELKKYFHYIYANVNKKIVHFLTFYISIHYLDFGNKLKNNI
ncbi:putative yir4 protein [Plasmodium yoelii yoelii]|uniref:Yir4 protein n=1 Tax=Plasmodium yoelii yoelii TaxID=73239 RepID=Q7R7K8_PLAYO|nr:putative yir4 protein [Plasmodium yoelii yoelii]